MKIERTKNTKIILVTKVWGGGVTPSCFFCVFNQRHVVYILSNINGYRTQRISRDEKTVHSYIEYRRCTLAGQQRTEMFIYALKNHSLISELPVSKKYTSITTTSLVFIDIDVV